MPAEVANTPPLLPPPPPPGAVGSPVSLPVTRRPDACANCGQPLHGPFCSNCGQHIRDLHRSTWRFVTDFLENAFSWDNKVFRTLQPLATQPGALTLDYLSGRRVRYVHPLRLFLFTSAICLTIIQHFGGSPVVTNFDDAPANKKRHGSGWNFKIGDSLPTPAPATEASPSPGVSPAATTAPAPAQKAPTDDDDEDDENKDATAKVGQDLANEIGRATTDAVRQAAATAKDPAAPAKASPSPGEDFVDQLARKAEARAKADGGSQRLQKEITANVQRRVSWVALALLPIFAMMLRGLYWRRDSYYFAHFVFSLHYHTFLLLFAAAYVLLQQVLPTSFWPVHTLFRIGMFLPGVYLYLALRRLYGESVRRTAAKVGVLGTMHVCVLFLGLTIVGAWAAYRAIA